MSSTISMKSVPRAVKSSVLFPFLDNPSMSNLRQVSREFASLSDHGEFSRIRSFCMKKFGDMILDIRQAVQDATSYSQLVEVCRELVDENLESSMPNDEQREEAESWLLDRVLGRAADEIAYSNSCRLEGAGGEDWDVCWSFLEDIVY